MTAAAQLLPYTVRQGDHLAQLAARLGFNAEQVWAHPRNAHLRQGGRTPAMLAPGDLLWIPTGARAPLKLKARADNTFRAAVPTVPVRVRFDDREQPFAGQLCIASWGSRRVPTALDGDGVLSLDVPLAVRFVDLHFPDRDYRCQLDVGGLDPAEVPSGIQQRLRNLGYRAPDTLARGAAVAHYRADHDHQDAAAPLWPHLQKQHRS